MGPFKGEVPVFARLWPVGIRVSFTNGAVWSAILATAGLLVSFADDNTPEMLRVLYVVHSFDNNAVTPLSLSCMAVFQVRYLLGRTLKT